MKNKFRIAPLVAAVSLSLLGSHAAVHAQSSPPPESKGDAPEGEPKGRKKAATQLETIEVTGIRASIEKSIAVKKDADTNVEVVTAEDVGKMPDKNIADALSRLPGVNVQYGGALAMDEAERLSIRGTSPNLNLTTVNGHALSSGDWHVGDQSSSGRSVGFGLLPSQLIGQAIVYKTGQADITEGGIAGTVDILTRRPLAFGKPFTGEISAGVVHATLADKTDPQLSGLMAWKNAAGTLGILAQAFKEDRHLRRDGQETFSYGQITAAQAAASGAPELAGLRMPGSLNSALFEGVRERQGGFLALQARPTRDVEVNLSAFHATLDADNYNSSPFALPTGAVAGGGRITNFTVTGDVITSATILAPTNANTQTFEYDNYVRQGAQSKSAFYDLDAQWHVTDRLSLLARGGFTEGSGVTRTQPGAVFSLYGTGISYQLNGDRAPDWSVTGVDLSNLNNGQYRMNTNSVVSATDSQDEERYFHLDGTYALDRGMFTRLKAGARASSHERSFETISGRLNNINTTAIPGCIAGVACLYPPSTWPVPSGTYPGDYGSGLGGTFPRNLFRFDADTLIRWAADNANWDPVLNKIWTSGYTVTEDNSALYAMSDFVVGRVTGNFGVRWVKTDVTSLFYQNISAVCPALAPCAIPGAINTSRFQTVVPQEVSTSHKVFLPSLNVRWDLGGAKVARLGVSRTLGRPNYNELAGAVTLNNTLLTGSGGNPNLKPIVADNLDVSLAWYPSPRAYMAVSAFAQRFDGYVKTGTAPVDLLNIDTGQIATYTVTSRIGTKAKLHGVEGAIEYPFGNFGVMANATWVDSEDADNVPMLGQSEWTYNVRGYYEDAKFSASLAWNYRTEYIYAFQGNATNTPGNGGRYFAAAGSLSASLGYRFNKNLSLHFDGNNLTNTIRYTYHIDENAPAAFYENGRQYFVTLRARF
jgi:iron complex outermembrane receptor protein